MFTVSALQVKAARAMLDWSRQEFAVATGLGVSTIRKIEEGNISPRLATHEALRRAIESAGFELIDNDGIKKRNSVIGVLTGKTGCKLLCDDIAETVRQKGGEIHISIQAKETLNWFFSTTNESNDCLSELVTVASVKCLLYSMPQPPYKTPPLEFRMVPRQIIDRFPCFIYGDRYATIVHIDSFLPPQFVICRVPHTARSYRDEFQDVWKAGQPMVVLNSIKS